MLNGCGFYGCHVLNRGDCECTKCSMTTGWCQDCNEFPARVRNDIFLGQAMQEKCVMCRDIQGRKQGYVQFTEFEVLRVVCEDCKPKIRDMKIIDLI